MIPTFTQTYDLLIKGGRVLDAGQAIDGQRDIAIAAGRISRIEANIDPKSARRVLDATGKVVTPGLVDIHTHVAGGLRRADAEETMLPPDVTGVGAGVTTVVDQGSTGALNIGGLLNYVMPHAKTRVLCFINVGTIGVMRAPEVRDASDIDVKAGIAAILARPDVIKGVKFRMVSPAVRTLGIELPKLAKEMADGGGVPVMVHVGDILKDDPAAAQLAPRLLSEVLTEGDIVTHTMSFHPGALLSGAIGAPGSQRRLLPEAKEARKRGVLFDVGVGRANFSFEAAKAVLDAGIVPDTLSSDLTAGSRYAGPTYSLTECMGKLMSVGLSLADVVRMTTSNAAKALRMQKELGSLQTGRAADVSVLEVVEGDFVFHDITGATNRGRRAVRPVCAVRAGEVMPLDYGPRPWGWLPDGA